MRISESWARQRAKRDGLPFYGSAIAPYHTNFSKVIFPCPTIAEWGKGTGARVRCGIKEKRPREPQIWTGI